MFSLAAPLPRELRLFRSKKSKSISSKESFFSDVVSPARRGPFLTRVGQQVQGKLKNWKCTLTDSDQQHSSRKNMEVLSAGGREEYGTAELLSATQHNGHNDGFVGYQPAQYTAGGSTLEHLRASRFASRRQSKIVCTIGPKSCSLESIYQLAEHGMNVARLNMSHGTHEWHGSVIQNIRQVNSSGKYNIGILLDTKGPEVRSGDLKAPIKVARGERFIWTVRRDRPLEQLSAEFPNITDVSYDDFIHDVNVGDVLLVDGGICSFVIKEKRGLDVISECLDEGVLTSRRHLNVRGKSASLPAITEKDWEDIRFGIEMNVDFYALSFVKHENDIVQLQEHLKIHAPGQSPLVLAKIESAQAVPRLRQILEVADGAMVARGDLGAEIPVEDVPIVQEEIVYLNRAMHKPTIVATHMLESMIVYPTPTRAEVTDITEAVRQGADATMLSGETANGAYPMEALTVMDTVAKSVFVQEREGLWSAALPSIEHRVNAIRVKNVQTDPMVSMTETAASLADGVEAACIIVFTKSGRVASLMSSARPGCPIYAFTPSEDTARKLTLFWGVTAFRLKFQSDPERTIHSSLEALSERGLMKKNDMVVIVSDLLVRDDLSVDSIQVRRA
jgi:pyruvate kinase